MEESAGRRARSGETRPNKRQGGGGVRKWGGGGKAGWGGGDYGVGRGGPWRQAGVETGRGGERPTAGTARSNIAIAKRRSDKKVFWQTNKQQFAKDGGFFNGRNFAGVQQKVGVRAQGRGRVLILWCAQARTSGGTASGKGHFLPTFQCVLAKKKRWGGEFFFLSLFSFFFFPLLPLVPFSDDTRPHGPQDLFWWEEIIRAAWSGQEGLGWV